MGIRDRLFGIGRIAAAAAGDALLDWANASFQKAAEASAGDRRFDPGDEGQENAPGGAQPENAVTDPVPTEKAKQDPKSLFWDPFAIVEQLGYKERPSAVTYNTLKMMMWRMPIVQSIIQLRTNQAAAFCRPQHNRYEMGFRVKTREQEREPSGADRKWAQQMETLLMRTGVTDNPRGRDNFEKFIRKLVWDSLVFDQMCFEVVPNRLGQPAEWYAVDAASVRLADTARTYMDEDLDTAVRYVQVYDSMIVAEYNQEELAFGIRNPRTDLRIHGYGISELEMLISVITSFLNTWDYNAKFFTQGSSAKGLLNFKGAINETQMRNFRRHWYQMISGVENAWKTPITNADEVQWVSMQSSNRDMEYNAWMDFLIKLTCSVYSMDPIEVNFKYGNVGQKGGLNESSNKEKITESRERGLRPLLTFLATQINQNIIWPINEEFEFAFVGLDANTREEEADLQTKQVKSYRTVDEIRASEDLPPLPNGAGEVILDPVWFQFSAQKSQAAGGAGMLPGSQMGNQDVTAAPGAVQPAPQVDFQNLLGGDEDPDEDEENGEEQSLPAGSGLTLVSKSRSVRRFSVDLKL